MSDSEDDRKSRGKRSFRVKKKKKTIRDSFPCEPKSVLLTSSPGFRAFEVYFQDLAITPFFFFFGNKVSSTHSYFLAIFFKEVHPCTFSRWQFFPGVQSGKTSSTWLKE